MTTRRNFIKKSAAGLTALAVNPSWAASSVMGQSQSRSYDSKRPAPGDRNFTSAAVEQTITRVKAKSMIPNWHGCSKTVSQYIGYNRQLQHNKTVNPIPLSSPAISTPCGCAIRRHRCGLICNLQNRIPVSNR